MSHFQQSRDLLQLFRSSTGVNDILVSFSGGRDSAAVLVLLLEEKFRVEGFFMHVLEGLACEQRMYRPAERLGVKIYSVPHWNNSAWLKYGVYRPHIAEALDLPQLKLPDIENYVREKSGIQWVASGHRKVDSLERRAMLSQCNLRDHGSKRLYPIGEWSNKEVDAYLRHHKYPQPPRFGSTGQNSGLDIMKVECLQWLKERYPDDLAKILSVYPDCEALIFRETMK